MIFWKNLLKEWNYLVVKHQNINANTRKFNININIVLFCLSIYISICLSLYLYLVSVYNNYNWEWRSAHLGEIVIIAFCLTSEVFWLSTKFEVKENYLYKLCTLNIFALYIYMYTNNIFALYIYMYTNNIFAKFMTFKYIYSP